MSADVRPLKAHFRHFFSAEEGRLHFAAHSHHPWPDVTFEAQKQAWLDAVARVDEKWDLLFGQVLPEAQGHVAGELGLPDPRTVVFAPNTHAFVLRLFSCLEGRPRILTSDSEFHSFERQLRRYEEAGRVTAERVPAEPFETFGERLVSAARRERPDLVFFSQVFFNSGAVVQDLPGIVAALPETSLVAIDGYHGFLAAPQDLGPVASRAFYLAGGYKYAMAGEGACFLHVPESAPARPVDTGWFSAFGDLQKTPPGQVPYASHGARFAGATFDFTALYRFNAAMAWRKDVGLTTAGARAHTHALQRRLVGKLRGTLRPEELLVPAEDMRHGHFLTFRRKDAASLVAALKARRVLTDARDDRFRLGFGVYHDEEDVDRLAEALGALPQQP